MSGDPVLKNPVVGMMGIPDMFKKVTPILMFYYLYYYIYCNSILLNIEFPPARFLIAVFKYQSYYD